MTGRRAAAPRHAAPVSSRPREVRLIGGQWKRSKLPVADHPGLRPTPDRVRETLFNWLGQDLSGWRVLDAFAGSGALGFEAASRGAASVVLLERDPGLVRSLQGIKTRLTADVVSPIWRAAALKPALSTTRTKTAISLSISIGEPLGTAIGRRC